EKALEGSDMNPEDVAAILAEAKAVEVSERFADAWVVGGDQTLSLGDEVFHKPADMEGARRHLLALSGKTHQLNSAIVIAKNGEAVWRHVAIARMTMRHLDTAFIGRHLSRVGDIALKGVGAYQVEGEGSQLLGRIAGGYFTIVVVALLPLVRGFGAVDAV